MKVLYQLKSVLMFLLICVSVTSLQSQSRSCGAQDLLILKLQSDPEFKERYQHFQSKAQEKFERYKLQKSVTDCPANKIVIPVAVHYSYNALESEKSCLRTLAQDQVNVLNADFNGSTCVVDNTGSCIQFQLGSRNHPVGSGLVDGDLAVTFNEQYGCPPFDPCFIVAWSGYLNLVIQDEGLAPGLIGIAPTPGDPDDEFNSNAVLIGQCVFGTSNTSCASGIDGGSFVGGANCLGLSLYDLGRTGTHEVGHFFNLWHTFCADAGGTPLNSTSNGSLPNGDDCENPGVCSSGCTKAACDCDFLTDTPPQAYSEYGCPGGSAYGTAVNPSTNPTSQYEYNNFLDYVNDACMTCFSPDQAMRMIAACNTNTGYATDKFACPDELIIDTNPVIGTYEAISSITTQGTLNIESETSALFNALTHIINEGLTVYGTLEIQTEGCL